MTGSMLSALDEGNLPRHAGCGKRRSLSRPGVIERARHDDFEAVLLHDAQRQLFLRELADGIRARRRDGLGLGDGLGRGCVDRRRSGNEDAAAHTRSAQRIEQVMSGQHVAGERQRGVSPRFSDVGDAGTVVDLRRPQLANGRVHAIAIEQIDGLPRRVTRRTTVADDVRRREVLDEMAAGKTARAGHENDRRSLPVLILRRR